MTGIDLNTILGNVDWSTVIGTFIAASVPSGIAIYLARQERKASAIDRREDRAQAVLDRNEERDADMAAREEEGLASAADRAEARLIDAAGSLGAAIDGLAVAVFADQPDEVSNATVRFNSAGLSLLLACSADDEAALRKWISRSAVLYREFTMQMVTGRVRDRRVSGAVVSLIQLQLADWMRGRASLQDLLLNPPEYRDKFYPHDEMLASIPVGIEPKFSD